jgi:hypothetical protein
MTNTDRLRIVRKSDIFNVDSIPCTIRVVLEIETGGATLVITKKNGYPTETFPIKNGNLTIMRDDNRAVHDDDYSISIQPGFVVGINNSFAVNLWN